VTTADGVDTITGGTGADVIDAGAGADTITGGAGNDTITLGSGADTLVFNSLTGSDTIGDYTDTDDTIQLSKGAFAGLGSIGGLTAAEFYTNGGATAGADASDRIVYDTTTGNLYYDPDGNVTGGDVVLIGTFTGAPLLLLGEFQIIA